MYTLMPTKILCAFLLLTIAYSYAQDLTKPGDCPPPIQYDVCYNKCYNDFECRNTMKCCPTSCGGSVCLRAVTMRNQQNLRGTFIKIDFFLVHIDWIL